MKRLLHYSILTLLSFVAGLAVLMNATRVATETISRSDYQVTTVLKNNGIEVTNNSSYGESKFVLTPTFRIADSVTLRVGDTIQYKLPDQFTFDQEVTRELKATDGTGEVHFATVRTDMATKIATIEIVNSDYFVRLGNNKWINVDLTAVWDRNVMPLNQPRVLNIEGLGDITLTRIIIDEEPRGISKWGVQRSDDPSIIEWRIRINRDLNTLTNVSIQDNIRPGQELVGTVRGHYFLDYYNPSPTKPNTALTTANSTITVHNNRQFSIRFEDMNARGAFIYYQTKLVDPSTVEASTTNIYNDVTLFKDGADPVVPFTGQAKITTLGGGGSADSKVVKTDLVVMKELQGRTQALRNGEFEFELVNANNAVVTTATNDANGRVTFKEVAFTRTGTYNYIVREKKAGQTQAGITYSTEQIPLTIRVTTDSQNNLVATVDYPADVTISNQYSATPATATLEAEKMLIGRPLRVGEFEFVLKNQADQEVEVVRNTNPDGTFSFSPLTFTAPGVYTYTITEKPGSLPGITYDDKVVTATVTVTDNGLGALVATVEYNGDRTFRNRYQAQSTTVTLSATKALTGRALNDREFEFTLKDASGQTVQVAENAADGTVTFNPITYTAAGSHTYTITENTGTLGGVTYDTKTITAIVTVTDDGQGQLVANVSYPDGQEFANTYTPAAGAARLSVKKVLTGRTLNAEEFEFVLKDASGQEVEVVKNAADGTVAFSPIVYSAAGIHTYTITEKAGSLGGVAYDASTITATVTVTDNGAGQLVTSIAYANDNQQFNNAYTAAPATAALQTTTVLNGRPLKAGEFSFTLTDAAGTPVEAVNNSQDGQVAFSSLSFSTAGTYTYTITEQTGTLGGVTYDTKTITATVVVTDNGQGQLVATVTYDDTQFVNQYTPGSVNATLSATKELVGRPLKAGEFTFALVDGSDTTVETVSNGADGSISFSPLTFTAAGTYTYTMKEVAGDLGGISYDPTVVTATVTVTDDGTGQLVASVSYANGDQKFDNSYAPAPVVVNVKAQTKLSGRPLTAGEFNFVLIDQDGKELQTVQNAADGAITFAGLTFTKAGTYTYTIRETQGTAEGMTYDKGVLKLKITVTDNQQGQLVASISYENDDQTLENVYKKVDQGVDNTDTLPPTQDAGTPEPQAVSGATKTKTVLPNTGENDVFSLLTLLGVSLLFLSAVVAYKRYTH